MADKFSPPHWIDVNIFAIHPLIVFIVPAIKMNLTWELYTIVGVIIIFHLSFAVLYIFRIIMMLKSIIYLQKPSNYSGYKAYTDKSWIHQISSLTLHSNLK